MAQPLHLPRPEAVEEPEFHRVSGVMRMLGVSKPWCFSQLKAGRLRGIKVGGVLLIEAASVREMLANGEPWKPGGERS